MSYAPKTRARPVAIDLKALASARLHQLKDQSFRLTHSKSIIAAQYDHLLLSAEPWCFGGSLLHHFHFTVSRLNCNAIASGFRLDTLRLFETLLHSLEISVVVYGVDIITHLLSPRQLSHFLG